jgi:peptidylprolyl isomerase
MTKKILFSFLTLFLALSLSSCAEKTEQDDFINRTPSNQGISDLSINLETSMNQEILKDYSQAEIKTNLGDFTIQFYNEEMPITVANFLNLADNGYFDGIKFHRVIEGFMVQGGDPLTKDDTAVDRWGTGGPGYAIEDEFVEGLSNVHGTISMANSGPNSGGSQFFINVADNQNLDFDKEPSMSKHPVFGEVIEGMDIVEKISKVSTDSFDRPQKDVFIEKVNLK